MFIAVTLAAAVWRYGATTADRDLWGHIRFGQDKIAAGGYLSTDTYSYLTEGQTWFNHEWLGEVAMAALYDGGGVAALVVVKALLSVGISGFIVWWVIRAGLEPIRAALLGLLAVVALTPTFGTFRPQMLTVFLFVVMLVLILGVEGGRSRLLWAVPPLFALWVNVHGGVIAGLAVLVAWAVLHAIAGEGRARWFPLLSALGGLAATGVHPLGYEHLWFLIRTTTVPRPEIQDWQPVAIGSVVGVVYLILVLLLALALWARRRKVRISVALPLAALAVAPLLSVRHLQLFVPALFLLGAPYLVALGRRERETSATSTSGVVAFIVVLVAVSLVSGITMNRAVGCIEVDAAQFEFPVRAVHAVAGMEGEAIVPFNWGEYIIWHAGPGLQVSIDGRRETVYPDDVLQANLDFVNAEGDWERLLEMGSPDLVIVPTLAPVVELLDGHRGWRIAYQDPIASILARIPSGSLRGDGTLPVDGDGLCFPA
jgi:hypothetical protein